MTNDQYLLKNVLEQELAEYSDYETVQDFFEFYSAKNILKTYMLSDEEIQNDIKDIQAA